MAKLTTRNAHEVARYVCLPPYTSCKRVEVVIRSDGAVLRKSVFNTWSDGFKRWPQAEKILAEKGMDIFVTRLTNEKTLHYVKA